VLLLDYCPDPIDPCCETVPVGFARNGFVYWFHHVEQAELDPRLRMLLNAFPRIVRIYSEQDLAAVMTVGSIRVRHVRDRRPRPGTTDSSSMCMNQGSR